MFAKDSESEPETWVTKCQCLKMRNLDSPRKVNAKEITLQTWRGWSVVVWAHFAIQICCSFLVQVFSISWHEGNPCSSLDQVGKKLYPLVESCSYHFISPISPISLSGSGQKSICRSCGHRKSWRSSGGPERRSVRVVQLTELTAWQEDDPTDVPRPRKFFNPFSREWFNHSPMVHFRHLHTNRTQHRPRRNGKDFLHESKRWQSSAVAMVSVAHSWTETGLWASVSTYSICSRGAILCDV